MGLTFYAGYLYVADCYNNAIRAINVATRQVTTLAGGISGFQDGIGANAQLHNPSGIAVDTSGSTVTAANFQVRTCPGWGAQWCEDPQSFQAITPFFPFDCLLQCRGRIVAVFCNYCGFIRMVWMFSHAGTAIEAQICAKALRSRLRRLVQRRGPGPASQPCTTLGGYMSRILPLLLVLCSDTTNNPAYHFGGLQ
jgi:DNA-binding beta-propeller fold protein YncE